MPTKTQPKKTQPKKEAAKSPAGNLVRVHRLIPGGYQCAGPMGPKGWHPEQLAEITVREKLTAAQRDDLLQQISGILLSN